MAAFPTLTPSSRTFTPGEYPHSVFTGMSGVQGRVRNSNVMLSSQLRLTFAAITEAQMLSILAHYQGQQGTFLSFPIPSAIWNAVSSVNDYQLAGYGWRYIEAPNVTDAMCANAYDVEVTIETVPPEGTAAAGLDFLVRTTLTAGAAISTFDFSIAVSLAAGSATAGATLPGLDKTVTWTLSEAGGDPDFSSVSLLLHMDGSNGSTTFTDLSSNGLAVTANGNAQISTAQSKFGGTSAYFDGTDDYLTLSTSATPLTLDGDFTIELWMYQTAFGDDILVSSANGGTNNVQVFRINSSGNGSIGVFINTWVVNPVGSVLSTNTWHHLALARSGSTTRLFVDGTQRGSSNTSWTASFTANVIAGHFNGGVRTNIHDFTGYIDELRITKGVARYTANFTPPTEAFPDS